MRATQVLAGRLPAMRTLATLLLLAAVAAGCGDDSGTDDQDAKAQDAQADPTESQTAANPEDFCAAISDFAAAAAGDDWPKVRAAGKDLEEAGLPGDAPAEADQGFDVVLKMIDTYDSNAEVEKNITDKEDGQVESLLTYTGGLCTPEGTLK